MNDLNTFGLMVIGLIIMLVNFFIFGALMRAIARSFISILTRAIPTHNRSLDEIEALASHFGTGPSNAQLSPTNMRRAAASARNQQREQRNAELALAGLPDHSATDDGEAREILSGTSLMLPRCSAEIVGLTTVEFAGGTFVRLFDWGFPVKIGKGVYDTLQQTVAAVNPVAIDSPAFSLRPANMMASRYFDTYMENMIGTDLDGLTAECQSAWAGEHFFRLTCVRDELAPFVRDRDWNVEWTGETLVVFALERFVEPDALNTFADDVVVLLDILKDAAQEWSTHMDGLVAVSNR